MGKLILFLSCGLAVIADMMLVWYAKHKDSSPWLFIIAIMISLSGIYVWQYSMRKGIESAMAITTYCLLTTVGCTILGTLVFNEVLSTANIIGIILSIISLILITL
jgi:multidrug transporter EmrE-like cation transporter